MTRGSRRYKEADDLQMASNAMHGRLKTDPDTVAVGINNLALLRRRQGHLHDALPMAERAFDRGRLDEAESQLRTALARLPDAKTLPHIERARTLMTLARLQTVRRRWNSAGVSLREARKIILATTGDGSLDMGRLLLREGLLLQARGDVSASRPPVQRAVAILQARLPPQQHRRVVAEHALQTATASPTALH